MNPSKLREGCLAYPSENQQPLTLYWGLACEPQFSTQSTVVEAGAQTVFEDTMAETGTQTTIILPAVKKEKWKWMK